MSRKSIAWTISAAVSLLIPAAAIFVWRERWWPLALFVVWTAAVGAFVVLAERRFEQQHRDRMIERMHLTALETLSHHRHDWMNEMQILYGYLRLGKPDKAVAVVERIRARMERDSRISRLGVPRLASYLLSFPAVCDTIRLEVEVEEGFGVRGVGPRADRLTTAVIGLVNAVRIRAATSIEEENVLQLHFHSDERTVTLDMTYEGRLAAMDGLRADIERLLDGCGYLTEMETERDEEPTSAGSRLVVAFPCEERAV